MAKSRPSPTAPTVVAGEVIADAAPSIPTIDLRVAQSKAEAALFGASEAVRIGRYRIIERVGAGGMGIVWSAWDPELGRAVALKLASSGDAAARALARDEARALARLSHPNVVPIYDVLDHDDRVLLVMELIKGESLRAASKARSPAQIVRDYRQAGEGLAAAHAAGLIHRDFKPDNALLGADGRVRVLDFGLAHDAGGGEGFVAGTPGYMAPEQERGEKLSPAVDQFALCVALRESLTARGGVPRWLQPVLARGTAAAPGDRYPTMSDLLAALARDPATRWRRRALVGGGALAIAGAAGAFMIGRAQQRPSVDETCRGGPRQLEASWGPSRRATIARGLGLLPDSYARDSVPALVASLDRYADHWISLHRDSCQAYARHELTAELYDRRTACLARPRSALAAIADLAERAGPAELPGLIQAATALPDVAACADDAALLADVAQPSTALAPEVSAIDQGLARVDVERDAGRVEDAARDVEPLVARAEATSYRPVLARALVARGRVAMTGERADWGRADFAAAVSAAIATGDDPLAVEAWARLAWSTAMTSETGVGPALDGLAMVRALDQRAGSRGGFARALLHNNLGGVALASGDRATALAEFQLARGLAAEISGGDAAELDVALENLLLLLDDFAEAKRVGGELIATRTRAYGATHPLTLQARVLAAVVDPDPATTRQDLVATILDLARLHPSLGHTIADLAREAIFTSALVDAGATVRQLADVVAATASRGADPAHLAYAAAFAHLAAGDAGAASAAFRRELATVTETPTTPWWQRKRLVDLRLGLALAELAAARFADATAEVERAAATLDGIIGRMPASIAARRHAAVAIARRRITAAVPLR
ncbi:MAG: serine/threonine protein kinase [Myxococcales bacterium]|nr:serine/threonine protein kinase [Myxococcales bacterium]